MKRTLFLTFPVVAIALAGTILYPPWLDAALPHAPDFLQRLLKTADASNPSGSLGKAAPEKAANGKRNQAALAVTAATAEQGELPVIERTYGIMQSPAAVPIAAQISGQVMVVQVKDGQDVKAGDLLMTLDDRTLQAELQKDQAALLKDKAVATSAASELQRAKSLLEKLAGTQQAYELAVSASRTAEANVLADEAAIAADQLKVGFTRITAPISGRLGAVNISPGALVNATSQTALMSITVVSPLKVGFKLPEALFPDIRSSLATDNVVKVRVLNSDSGEVLGSGVLDFVDSSIDNASGTIAMSSTIDNSALKLWPGQHVAVEVEHGMLHPAAVIPTVAVEPGQSGPFVWLIRTDNTVEMRPVEVTRNESGKTAISSGLVPGDRVVVEGQLRLKPGSAVLVAGTEPPAEKIATHEASGRTKAIKGGERKFEGANPL